MRKSPLEAYETASMDALSGRELEAAVLTKAALRLKDCQDNWESEDNETRLFEALKYNQKVWSFFQGELTRDDNPLPQQLKENILSLSVFIDRRIIDIMAYPEADKLKIIIDINLNLAAGLREKNKNG